MRHIIVVIKMALFSALIVAGLSACGSGSSSGSTATTKPTIWANVTVAPANQQVTISWAKLTTAGTTGGTAGTAQTGSTYTIYWSTTPGVNKHSEYKVANVTSPFVHTGLSNGTIYYYVITETTAAVEGSESQQVAAAPRATIPATPTGITMSPLNAGVQFKILRSSTSTTTSTKDPIKYNLYYWDEDHIAANPTKIANAFGTGSSASTTYIHNGLNNGTKYFYRLSAENTEGESPKTEAFSAVPTEDITTPPAPNAITITPGNGQMTLTWNMPVTLTGALITSYSSFNIYYWTETTLVPDKLTVSDLSKLKDQKYVYTVKTGDKLGSTLTYIKTALPNNREYRYVITAVAAAGNTESLFGSQISAFPEAKTPAAPSGLSATSGTQKVTLAWTPDTDKTISYKVYFSNRIPAKSEDLVTDANLISPTINGTYSHTGLTFGTTYYYVVTSVADNESVPSAIVAVTM